jgi:hypothetical protein
VGARAFLTAHPSNLYIIPSLYSRPASHAIASKMQRMQRLTGRFMTNRVPNEADVEAMLKDFNDSKTMLEKVRLLRLLVLGPGGQRCCELVGLVPDHISFLASTSKSRNALLCMTLPAQDYYVLLRIRD